MARVCPLFSSSKANSTYIGGQSSGILIDAGASYRGMLTALNHCSIDIDAVKGVFITHEHSDHIKGLHQLQKQREIPIFASSGTLEYLIHKKLVYSLDGLYEITDNPMQIADMEIKAFHTPHDCEESFGYTIHTSDDRQISICTDLGEVTEEVANNLKGSDLCLIESNYDEQMLRSNTNYPTFLKNRISSKVGHLSNTDSAEFIKTLVETGTTRIVLGHLSQNNNLPSLASKRVLDKLDNFQLGKDFTLDVAPVSASGMVIAL